MKADLVICPHTAAKLYSHLAYYSGPFTLEDISRVIVCMHFKYCSENLRLIPVSLHHLK